MPGEKPRTRIDRPKDGTHVKIAKIRGKVRLTKTATGTQIEFKASGKTTIKLTSRS